VLRARIVEFIRSLPRTYFEFMHTHVTVPMKLGACKEGINYE